MADNAFKKCLDTFLNKISNLDNATRESLLSSFTSHIGSLTAKASEAQPSAPAEKAGPKVPPGGQSSVKFGGDDMDNKDLDDNDPKKQRVKRAKEAAKLADEEKKKGDGGRSNTGGIFGSDDPPAAQVRTSTGGVRQRPGGETSINLSDSYTPTVKETPKEAPKESPKESPKEAAGPIAEDVVPDSLRASVSEAVYRKGKLKDTLSKWNQNRSKVLTSEDIFNGIKGCGVDITRGHAQWFFLNFKTSSPDGEGVNYSGLVRMLTVDKK